MPARWTAGLAALLLVALLLLTTACQAPESEAQQSKPETPVQSVALADSLRTPPADSTAARFADVMEAAAAQDLRGTPVGPIMQTLGLQFRGASYLEGTLDAPPTETLVVRLDGFDCVTFMETTMAMARGVAQGDRSYEGFARRLAQQRYRAGTIGYCSRLHYFTDWLVTNERRGLVRIVSNEFGSRVLRDTLDFMSTHRSAYDRFAANDSLFACIQDMEAHLQATQPPVRYVPQDSIRAVYDRLRAGDLLAFVTPIDGLDVAHTGLVYKGDDGATGLLHASLSDGVTVFPDLQRYVQQFDTQIGIVVARPQRAP